jgi:cytochrome oxidase Cu insertion factor (SCO1/SenC/PrrC family)
MNPRAGRNRLILLAVLFFAPLFAAVALYYYLPKSWQPQSRTNHGHLVSPARPLDRDGLRNDDGSPLASDLFQQRWTLLYIGGSRCDAACRNTLYLSRQVRTSLGRDTGRLQRIYVSTDTTTLDGLHELLDAEHPDLRLALASGEAGRAFVDFFSTGAGMDPGSAGNLYLLDPHGNWLMYYTPQDPARGMLEDLKKLLRLSSIG